MYRYKQLNPDRKEIRLLLLEPGCDTDIIRGTLEHTFLDNCPARLYETISYVCGDPDTKRTILVHDTEFQVPVNSEAVLRRMRNETTTRILWIDAVCINQEDVKERGHQVGMMYLIYTNTFRNLIWLGEDDGHTAEAIESIKAVLKEIDAATQSGVELGRLLMDDRGRSKYSRTGLSADLEKSFLPLFFSSTWFSRLWVVQEASLAPFSICHRGRLEVPLAHVLRIASWVHYKQPTMPKPTPDGIRRASIIFNFADKEAGYFYRPTSNRKSRGMSDILMGLRYFHALDRRDHSFASLGLWQKLSGSAELPTSLTPDYTLSIRDVFENATRLAIRESGHLFMLSWDRGPREDREPEQWPSWVQRLDGKTALRDDVSPLPSGFYADYGAPMDMVEENDRRGALEVSGFVVDRVAKATAVINNDLEPSRFLASMIETERPHCGCWVNFPAAGNKTKVGLTLLAGVGIDKSPIRDSVATREYQAFKKYVADHDKFPPGKRDLEPTAAESDKLAARFRDAIGQIAWRRVVFHTEQGHIGLGPASTRVGDVVAILYGSRLPAVLRSNDEDVTFRLQGMSYVYGIMDGQAVRRHRARGFEDRMFTIV